jgi:hypothetical protein
MKRFLCVLSALLFAALSLSAFGAKPLLTFNDASSKAELKEGGLIVDVSFSKASWAGLSGDITAEVIDASDAVLLESQKSIRFFRRTISTQFEFQTDLSEETLLGCRLRITFKSKGKQQVHIVSFSQLVDRLELMVLGQNSLLIGSKASIRIVALNYRGRTPIERASVTVALKSNGLNKRLFAGKTNRDGSIDATFEIPDVDGEGATIAITADAAIGEETVEYAVSMKKAYAIYLVTDKPVYQPGQIIHMRALSLQEPMMNGAAGKLVTMSVEDAKGNKVFKKVIETDEFGIVSCDFQLADELNTGDYRIRAEMEHESVEKTVNVKRYVLPKFKIVLETDKEYYLPSERLEGDLCVEYFFGKPVDGGKVQITLSKFDVGFEAFQEISGETDSKGNYHFDVKLPEHFVGTPLEQGKAFIKIDVEVTDRAEHTEKLSTKKTVAKYDLSVVLIPESGSLVPGLKNILYAMVTYPDGTPAVVGITLKSDGKVFKAKSDDGGIAEFSIMPAGNDGMNFEATAVDARGNAGGTGVYFSYDSHFPHILLRADKGLYKVGETMEVTCLSSKKHGVVYLDLIKDKQTVLTKTISIKGGIGRIAVPLTTDVSGSVWIHAYTVAAGKEIMRDTKVIYVNPANDLSIAIKADKAIYRPGEEGSLKFSIRDERGHPVIAALGISIVDESVFALTEMQPGLEKVYFTLEKELMEPKYEIHYLTPREIVTIEPGRELEARKEKAAKVLFASLSELSPFSVSVDNTSELDNMIYNQYSSTVWNDLYAIQNMVNSFYDKEERYPTVEEGFAILIKKDLADEEDFLDPWGVSYEVVGTENDLSWFGLLSYGPDKIKDTGDDINTLYYGGVWGFDQRLEFFDKAEGVAGGREVFAKKAALPEAAVADEVSASSVSGEGKEKAGPRIREYFPETFVFEPALVTDSKGVALLPLKWPDSITEWRITTIASSVLGQLGSSTKGIKVFQDFFIDIDLPVSLTQNDIVSIPVALYNYVKGNQKITLTLEKEPWYELLDDAEKSVTLAANEVSVIYFRLRAKDIGKHRFTVKAVGTKMSDAIRREIEIVPDGKKFETIASDRLDGKVTKTVYIPKESIAGSGKIFVRIFPGMVSQVVEGMESMLGMPFGCFEQTSSVTYPNILILDYLRGIGKITPEIEMKAEQYINVGYQRLLAYEVPGGGFDWFGNPPANRILSAYGLMEFFDMAEVFEVDPGIVPRTQQWLIAQQNKDGSWTPDESYLHQDSWNRIQKNRTLPTAYILWALAETGYRGDELEKAASYIEDNLAKENDSYILAICANAFVAYDAHAKATEKIFQKLMDKRIEEKDEVYWESDIPTFTYAKGKGADIEATALATYALIKYDKYINTVNKAIGYLVRSKYPGGTWGSTQATVLSLKCLLASLKGSMENVDAVVKVHMNGIEKETITLDKTNADMMFLVDCAKETVMGENKLTIEIDGKGSPMYEIASRFYVPWHLVEPEQKQDILSIDLTYDKTKLTQDDVVTCRVKITNNISASADMVIVDLGIPPGFTVESADLQALVRKKIQKYNLTTRQVILYIERIDYKQPIDFSYRLKAKFPIKAKTPTSKVYKYYEPEVETLAEPVTIEVKG